MAANVPLGFRFKPSEEEVIQFIRLLSEGQECDEITWADLYGKEEPWDIFRNCGKEGKKVVYFATRLKGKTAKGTRIRRTVGTTDGTWNAQHKATGINPESSSSRNNRTTIIGWMKSLRYQNKSNKSETCQWLMKEYSLNRKSKPSDLVICRIKNKRIDVDEEERIPDAGFAADDEFIVPEVQEQNQPTVNANYNYAEADANNNSHHIQFNNNENITFSGNYRYANCDPNMFYSGYLPVQSEQTGGEQNAEILPGLSTQNY